MTEIDALFRGAMSKLVSGVTVVTAGRPDGEPCGLVATSMSAFSARPPSVLVSIGHVSRCHHALLECEHFGVHLLSAGQEPLAQRFASSADEDKFGDLDWAWDDDVPSFGGVVAYLRCRRSALFELYDHSILIGDLAGGHSTDLEPLVWMVRRMDWRITPS